jgi:peroxiredoxin
MIAISCDSARKILQLKEKMNYSWSFISDRSGKIPKAYHVYASEPLNGHDKLQVKNAIPSKFLIDKSGTIVWKYVGSKTQRPTMEQIIDAIDQNLYPS